MKLNHFDIDFIKFKNEKDVVRFEINDTFFTLKENSLHNRCDIAIEISCEKSDNTLTLVYDMLGHVYSQCERCLNDISIAVKTNNNDVLKLTNDEELLQQENYLSANHQVYSTYDSIYEQICLSMPTRLICENSITNKICEIAQLQSASEEVIDERWAELKKLIK